MFVYGEKWCLTLVFISIYLIKVPEFLKKSLAVYIVEPISKSFELMCTIKKFYALHLFRALKQHCPASKLVVLHLAAHLIRVF